ncbi:hypothetical protein BGZ61DRAFT_500254 [Ilyonectria robusta]|uniref:uncharacterized protein n=1 Tax=Ilyonectria robusta TaxID=1079257 RepID=UPI001E8EBBE5|nr:uncharacterized protein BGZ61DRAFT_500254 [Ilyonectria robusta]KAH8656474.1 hypothetical protein BGZ61DRAFT_500254 [Ilyonectria robusta]
MTTEATVRKFFASSAFAVVGASSNPAKFSHRVFAWYLYHDLPVTPINPDVHLSHHSPSATLKVLQEAKELGIPSAWLQPGSFDDDVLKFANEQGGFDAVVAGDGGRGHEGCCILVDGERGLKAAGKL